MKKTEQLIINPINRALRDELLRYKKEHKITTGKLIETLWINFKNPETAYTEKEQELIQQALVISGLSFSTFSKKALIKTARNAVNNNKTNPLTKVNIHSRTSSRAADLRVTETVGEIMLLNDIATEWHERKHISQRSISEYSKELKEREPNKLSLNLTVIKRYLDSNQDAINEHHAKYDISDGHNSRAFNYRRTHKATNEEQ